MLVSSPSVGEKVYHQPMDGHRFHFGTARCPPSIILAAVNVFIRPEVYLLVFPSFPSGHEVPFDSINIRDGRGHLQQVLEIFKNCNPLRELHWIRGLSPPRSPWFQDQLMLSSTNCGNLSCFPSTLMLANLV